MSAIKQVVDQIAAYLESEAAKTPRARVRARTLRIAAGNVRAGLWRDDEAALEGVRARYNDGMPEQGRVG